MRTRLRTLGIVLAVIGLFFVAGGGYAYAEIQAGYDSLQTFSEAQNVTLSYNEDGELIDRGTTEGAQAILTLLTEEWGYPADMAELDPADPLVNTDTEYMFQMATIVHHTTTGTATVVLDEPALDADGNVLYEAGTYEVELDGRYWTEFDRTDPLDGVAREMAWPGTVHGLVGELGVGTVTHSALQMGLGIAALLGGLGGTFLLLGAGLFWAAREDDTTYLVVSEEAPAAMSV